MKRPTLTKPKGSKNKGKLIFEGSINGTEYVVIATKGSVNEKTGPMVQIWIIVKDTHPVAAVRSGLDAQSICTGCPFASGNGCYVNVAFAPSAIWNSYQRGLYDYLMPRDYPWYFGGNKVRFGAYGNPTLMPFSIAKAIATASDGWTGYFHNWKDMAPAEAQQWNTLFMASTETKDSLSLANSLDLRVFHAAPEKPEGFVECLADSRDLTCSQCLLCQGTNKKAKPIWINPHGYRTKAAVKQASL